MYDYDILLVSRVSHYDFKFMRRSKEKCRIKIISSCSPNTFLSALEGAQLVITDSFHGTALSIIQHKQFICVADNRSENTNSRLYSLLKVAGLEDRIITKVDTSVVKKNIDFDEIQLRINPMRKKSLECLKDMVIK